MNEARAERNWVLWWAIAIVLLSSIPYLWGMLIAPPGYSFIGLTHNIDDGAVYLSWMRQAADGHIFARNLFTNEPQSGRQINLLFLKMGMSARTLHLPLIWIFHIFRAVIGFVLILSIWQFSKLFLESGNARRILIPLVGLSAGVGWLIPGAKAPTGPVDTWQPEAITFLSIYLNPLFLAGLLLMIWGLYFLILAQRTGRARYAACAGLSALFQGNTHTYDILTIACVWTAYLVVVTIIERKFLTRTVLLSLIAALIAIPSVAYQFHLYQIDEVFRARANSPAPSPVIWSFFLGYGLILLGAIVGAVMLLRRHSTLNTQNSALLIVWSVVGFALPYIPIAQQRKLVMGLHIPLCILCAYALAKIAERAPRSVARGAILGFILIAAGSNVQFMARDLGMLSVGETAPHYAAFMSARELAAMRYIRESAGPSDTIFAPPTFALFVPTFTGRRVYYGHWSETPDYGEKVSEFAEFIDPFTTNERRTEILKETGALYYVSLAEVTLPPREFVRDYLDPVFRSGPVEVFRVR